MEPSRAKRCAIGAGSPHSIVVERQ
jgi:hypothetical protein